MDVAEGWFPLEGKEWPADQNGEDQIPQRATRRGEAAPSIGSDRSLVQVNGTAGQPDPADEKKDDRQRDAQDGMRVLQRIER